MEHSVALFWVVSGPYFQIILKNLPGTNTLAYFAKALLSKRKKFYNIDSFYHRANKMKEERSLPKFDNSFWVSDFSDGATTLGTMTLSIMTLSIMTFSLMTFSLMTPSLMMISLKSLRIMARGLMALSIMTLSLTTFSLMTLSIIMINLISLGVMTI